MNNTLNENLIHCPDWTDYNVQEHWKGLENVIVNTVDQMAPLSYFNTNLKKKSEIPKVIRNKINRRKIFLKLDRLRSTTEHAAKIRILNKEIRDYFYLFQFLFSDLLIPTYFTLQVNNFY